MKQHIRIIAEKFKRISIGKFILIDKQSRLATSPDVLNWATNLKQQGYRIRKQIYRKAG